MSFSDRQYFLQSLAECRLSIHPIGRHYGVVPEGGNRSLVELQHELAAGRDGVLPPQTVIVPTNLVIRESTAGRGHDSQATSDGESDAHD